MHRLLVKLFVKNYENYEDPKVRTAYGKLSGVVGIISNLLLAVFKIISGLLVGSLAIMADGLNNLSDASASIITLIGFKVSSLPADKDHPYGHQRVEYITGLVVSFLILVVGGILFKSSIEKIITPTVLEVDNYTLIMLTISILIKVSQSLFYYKNGKLINSKALITTATDSRNDCFQTGAVLIACLVYRYAGFNIDGYISLLVSVMIVINGIKLIKETASPLIGEAPSLEFIDKVSKEILSYPGIIGIHDLVIHSYGPAKTFVTVHAEVDSRVDISLSHDVIDNIETDFKKRNIDLVIHMDPIDMIDEDRLRLEAMTRKIIVEIDENLEFHDFRIVKGPTHTNLIFDLVMPSKYQLSSEELKIEINKRIKAVDKKLNVVITIDYKYY
ncbi:MAG: cation diffusion facilitator family transporter [Bacilli bacterium]|nr:cation diffusion facilitator family transporter [Bacilli bacterium]